MTAGILFFVCFYLAALLTGSWGDVILDRLKAKRSPVFALAFGGCSVLAVSMAVCLAGAALSAKPSVCATVSVIVTAALAAAGLMKKRAGTVHHEKPHMSTDDKVFAAIAAVSVLLQIVAVTVFRYGNSKALLCVPTATRIFESGRLEFGDPMMLFTGVVASILHMHPLRVIYVILPAVLITLYYLCLIEVICTVCRGRSRIFALAALVMLNLWGYQSDVLIPLTLLISWYSAGVYIVHGLLGILAIILIRYFEGKGEITQEDEIDDDIPEEWDMKKHRIINARNLAIALGVLAVILAAAVVVLNNKINKLYDATVNLQTDMNGRCSIYEFTTSGGEKAGYLIKGSDGTMTFVGGGPADNADELAEFLDRYGNEITQWYVYGDDDADSGAMNKLTESAKVNVGKIYVIDRKEITGR